MRQQPKNRTMWACAFPLGNDDQPYVVEVPVLESKKLYTVTEKALDKEQLSRVRSAVGFRTRIEKDCRILFDAPDAAIHAKIAELNEEHAHLLRKAQKVLQKVEAVQSLL